MKAFRSLVTVIASLMMTVISLSAIAQFPSPENLLGPERFNDARKTETPPIKFSDRATTSPTESKVTAQPWKAWGLTESDWRQYENIMAGPRGIWTPNISPISALGVHAKTDVERMRYAEIAARQDWDRLMAERAWYLTYETAKERIFAPRLAALLADQPTLMQVQSHDRLVLFTDDQCNPTCRRVLSHVMSIGASLDIYFVGTSDRAVITQWAKTNNIAPEKVNATKQVTLNVDTGFFQRIAIDTTLPQLFRRDNGQKQLTEVRL